MMLWKTPSPIVPALVATMAAPEPSQCSADTVPFALTRMAQPAFVDVPGSRLEIAYWSVADEVFSQIDTLQSVDSIFPLFPALMESLEPLNVLPCPHAPRVVSGAPLSVPSFPFPLRSLMSAPFSVSMSHARTSLDCVTPRCRNVFGMSLPHRIDVGDPL